MTRKKKGIDIDSAAAAVLYIRVNEYKEHTHTHGPFKTAVAGGGHRSTALRNRAPVGEQPTATGSAILFALFFFIIL